MSLSPEIPGVLAPPPLIFLTFVLLAWALGALCPQPTGLPPAALQAWAAVLAAAGLSLALGALGWFRKRGTDPRPWKPSEALVVEGPYRWTRNPMYLAMTLFFLALGFWRDTCWHLALLPLLVEVINRGVIWREERYLKGRFGQPYRRYLAQVRRWL
jgi:protein-S-isoprenylcysteine O-methyltransferase Ste14